MAPIRQPNSLLLLLFLATFLAAATTTTTGFIINGIPVSEIRILGRVTCHIPPPAPPPESRPILNGTNVVLSCAGRVQALAHAVADIGGFYELVYSTVDSVVFDPSSCFVVVRLPIARCFIYPPTGTLRATLTLVGFLQPLFNAVAILTAGPLELVT